MERSDGQSPGPPKAGRVWPETQRSRPSRRVRSVTGKTAQGRAAKGTHFAACGKVRDTELAGTIQNQKPNPGAEHCSAPF